MAICLAILFVLLAVMPTVLRGQMPRDWFEPHTLKLKVGAGIFLGFFYIAAFGVSMLSLLTAIFAFVRRDRIAFVIALPAPCIALIVLAILWLNGM